MKKVGMVVGLVIVLFAVIAAVVFMQLNRLVADFIEKYGKQITGVDVSVGKVEISPQTGEGAIFQFTLGNPPGYQASHAFTMEKTSVVVDVKSLQSDVIVIDSITMDGPQIVFELASTGGNNFQAIKTHVDAYLAQQYNAGTTDKELAEKQIIVKDFYLNDGSVIVSAPVIEQQTYHVALPPIHLKNLGQNQGKGNAGEVMQTVTRTITDDVIKAVGPVTLKNFSQFVLGAPEGVVNTLEQGVETPIKGIEKIFGQ